MQLRLAGIVSVFKLSSPIGNTIQLKHIKNLYNLVLFSEVTLFLFDISFDHKVLQQQVCLHRKKKNENLEKRSEALCSRGCLWKSCWRLPAISAVWCAAQGTCQGRLHKNSNITKNLRAVWLVKAPWGGNHNVLSHCL